MRVSSHHGAERADVLQRMLDRNIANSQKIISGAFEVVLEDLITQMEESSSDALPLSERTHIIAGTLRDGFAGLPPNGFEFCQWLWDAAPLHAVRIPLANDIGTAQGFRYGVIHLRSIASQVLLPYAAEQPQRIESIEEMLDSSIGWVDARNHVRFALLDHFISHFAAIFNHLLDLTAAVSPFRCFIPMGVAARMLAEQQSSASGPLLLVEAMFERVGEDVIFEAMRYLLRIGGMYGDAQVLLEFLDQYRAHPNARVRALICEFIGNPRLRWARHSREEARNILIEWKRDSAVDIECLDRVLLRLVSA